MNVAQFIFVAVCFVVLPLVAIGFSWRPYLLAQKLRERGLSTQGTMVRVEDAPDDGHTFWKVEYVFQPPGGPEVRGRYRLSEQGALSIPREGAPLEVRYLPDNPRRHQCEGQEAGLGRPLLNTCLFLSLAVPVLFSLVQSLREGLN